MHLLRFKLPYQSILNLVRETEWNIAEGSWKGLKARKALGMVTHYYITGVVILQCIDEDPFGRQKGLGKISV